jgi:hypothetical protein
MGGDTSWPEAIKGDWMRHDKSECDWHSYQYIDPFSQVMDGALVGGGSVNHKFVICDEEDRLHTLSLFV